MVASAAPADAAVRSVGTTRIESAAAIRIVESANTQLELAHAGITLTASRDSGSLAATNFLVLTADNRRRRDQQTARDGAGTNLADEALSVSVSGQHQDSEKVSGALTTILANYY